MEERAVVIVGVPNGGKSTLFNRLTHTRRSITSPVRGVTRDLIKERCSSCGIEYTLIDTGGIKSVTDDVIDTAVKGKSLSVIESSSAVLLVIDGKNVSPEDEEMIEKLRPYSDKVILVVNKLDSVEQDALLWNYYAYGYSRIVGISAEHNRGINALHEHIAALVALDGRDSLDTEKPNGIRVSIMGKPNAGKSTLINAIAGKDISIVSHIPGTTRDTVDAEIDKFGTHLIFTDTAGIRRKGKVTEDVEYYSVNRAISTIEEADVVILLISAEEDVSDQDKKIASLIVDRGKPIILAINKSDKWTINGAEEAYTDRLRFLFPVLSFAPIVSISAKNKTNLDVFIKKIIMLHNENHKRISTSDFNASLTRWKEKLSPARGKDGRAYKILYGTAVSVAPQEFVLFVNRTDGFPENYVSYIKNKIRAELSLAHIPIKVTLRARR